MRQITVFISVISQRRNGSISSTAKDPEAQSVYEMYYEFRRAGEKACRSQNSGIKQRRKGKIYHCKGERTGGGYSPLSEQKSDHTVIILILLPILKEVTEDSYKRLIRPGN